MKATETPILRFLQGPKQFVVPIFQRRYSWEQKHCQKLWDDVLKAGENDEIKWHFLGSIVYMEPDEEQHTVSVPRHQVIDGQQRLTTLSLLLLALSRAIKEDSDIDITPKQLLNYYLFNDGEKEEFRHKQVLTKGDKNTLIYLLESKEILPQDPSPFLVKNYQFFEKKVKDVDLKTLYTGLGKLMIVDIVLNREGANPQLIFESLNSTGIPLSQADLIRNYMLMGKDITLQNRLYYEYWFDMEQSFRYEKKEEYTKRINSFMRDYLTLKTEQIPNRNSVYIKFKDHFPDYMSNPKNAAKIVGEISRYAKHYVDFTKKEEDPELLKCLEDIWELRAEVVYPFLLEVYDYYQRRYIEKSEVIKTLRLVESYVFRRAICGLSGKFLNQIFLTILRDMSKDNANNYIKSLNATLLSLPPHRRCPKDDEFKEALLMKDIYHLNRSDRRCKYMLRRLENYERKEPISSSDEEYTIEHVMPQTLTEEWKKQLGENFSEIHAKYLHTIGNLTLTGRNSEFGNKSFIEKRDMCKEGFSHSTLYLNDSLGRAEEWNEDAIKTRASELAEKACKAWIYPEGDRNLSFNIDDLSIGETYNTPSAPQKLRVTMPDGEVIDHQSAQATFFEVIEKLGPERVIEVDVKGVIISTDPSTFNHERFKQYGNYYISINHGTPQKMDYLEKFAHQLGIQLRIEIVEK